MPGGAGGQWKGCVDRGAVDAGAELCRHSDHCIFCPSGGDDNQRPLEEFRRVRNCCKTPSLLEIKPFARANDGCIYSGPILSYMVLNRFFCVTGQQSGALPPTYVSRPCGGQNNLSPRYLVLGCFGNLADLPTVKIFPSDWQLGEVVERIQRLFCAANTPRESIVHCIFCLSGGEEQL